MAFSISDFRSSGLKQSGARPNLFDVAVVGAPDQGSDVKSTEFTMLCKIASVPTSTVGVIEVPYFGRMVKIPGNRTFDNLSVTVINDEDFKIRNGVEKWMDSLNSHESNKSKIGGAASTTNLSGTIVVNHYKRDGEPTPSESWTFVNCYPVALGEIGLDWGSNDTIEEFTIDWAYYYWTHGEFTS